MKVKISIITVVYNGEKFLENTILSIINQTYKNIEYIIVDGNSTDNTYKIIEQYKINISTSISENDSGIYDAMNKGIMLSTGDYITFLNAGDSYVNDDVLTNLFNNVNTNIDVIYGDHIAILNNKKQYREAKEFNINNMCKYLTSTVCHQSIFVKKDIIPFYSLDYKLKSELNWYFDILSNTNLISLHKKLPIVYYLRGGIGEQKYMLNLKEILLVLKNKCPFPKYLKANVFLLKYTIKVLLIITKRYKFED